MNSLFLSMHYSLLLHLAEEAVKGDGAEEVLLHHRVLPTLQPVHQPTLALPPVKVPETLMVTRVIEGGEGRGGGGLGVRWDDCVVGALQTRAR